VILKTHHRYTSVVIFIFVYVMPDTLWFLPFDSDARKKFYGPLHRPGIAADLFRHAHKSDSLSWTAARMFCRFEGSQTYAARLRFRTDVPQGTSCPAPREKPPAVLVVFLVLRGPESNRGLEVMRTAIVFTTDSFEYFCGLDYTFIFLASQNQMSTI
jgi:hypothetical protein